MHHHGAPDRRGVIGSIVRAAQLQPWRTVERCALVLLVLHLASGRACRRTSSGQLCAAGHRQCCCASEQPGPLTVFAMEGVSHAPPPTMALSDLKPGQTVAHHDFRGDIYRFPMGSGVVVNLMRTTAGTMRSGDLHNCTQFDVVLKGRARLHTYDTVGQQESSVVYDRNDFIKIPARVPHLFEFLEENYMLEWWDCPFAAWYYKPYRDIISSSFARAQSRQGAAASSHQAGSQADHVASKPATTLQKGAALQGSGSETIADATNGKAADSQQAVGMSGGSAAAAQQEEAVVRQQEASVLAARAAVIQQPLQAAGGLLHREQQDQQQSKQAAGQQQQQQKHAAEQQQRFAADSGAGKARESVRHQDPVADATDRDAAAVSRRGRGGNEVRSVTSGARAGDDMTASTAAKFDVAAGEQSEAAADASASPVPSDTENALDGDV